MVFHKVRYLVQNYLQFIHCLLLTLPVKTTMEIHLYADDTQIYITFRTSDNISEEIAIKLVQSCIAEIKIGMLINKLQLSDGKTEFLLIASPYFR